MKREHGFTLIELLLAITIMAIVVAAIAQALVVGLHTVDVASTRLAESNDAQLIASYFVADVNSSDDVSTSDTACAGVAPVVRLSWTEGATTKVASYFVRTVGSQRELVRAYCENGALVGGLAPLARSVHSSANPVILPTGSLPRPSRVKLTVTENSGFSFDITGSRRAP